MQNLSGIGASAGISIAKVYKLEAPEFEIQTGQITDIDAELARFNTAIETSIAQIELIKETAAAKLGEATAAVFEAHILVLKDPELVGQVSMQVKNDSVNCMGAFDQVTQMFINIFASMEDEYMKERAADIKDVSKRVLANLAGVNLPSPALIDAESIIVAHDLTPSETAQLNEYVKGFVTEIGGRTSHSAIMARTLEIPAVLGLGNLEVFNEGDLVIIDGEAGDVIINPDGDTIAKYEALRVSQLADKEELKKLISAESISADGVHAELAANIGTPDDVAKVLEVGADGVGLYRTEFLYMNSSELPTEEEQFVAYKTVLENMGEKPVVIRTLDIGGDKELDYLKFDPEMNPFLGYRAIRLCLDRTDIFKTQLRALVRASVFGNLKIMFPMIATLNEFRAAKTLLLECKAELINEGIEVGEFEIGLMVEIPAAAMNAHNIAKEADFFSIGTNDLIQYTMAADRMNTNVAYLYQPYNPSILRLIKNVIDASHAHGKWTGMCGEMAGEEMALPILFGLGLDEFSMSATSILRARRNLSKITKADAEKLAAAALECGTEEEVVALIKNF